MVSRKVSAAKRSAKRKASKTPRKAVKKTKVTSRPKAKAVKRTPAASKKARRSAVKRTASKSAAKKRAPVRTPRKAVKKVKASTATKKKVTTPKKASSKAVTPRKSAMKKTPAKSAMKKTPAKVSTPKKSPKKSPKKTPKKARTPKKNVKGRTPLKSAMKKPLTPKRKAMKAKKPASTKRKPAQKAAVPAAASEVDPDLVHPAPKVTVESSAPVEEQMTTPKKGATKAQSNKATPKLKSAMKKTSKKNVRKEKKTKKTFQTPEHKKGVPTPLRNLRFRTPSKRLRTPKHQKMKPQSAMKSAQKAAGTTDRPIETFFKGSRTVRILCDFLLHPPRANTKASREQRAEIWKDAFENARTVGVLCRWPIVKKCVDRTLNRRIKSLGQLAKLATIGNTGDGYGPKGFGCTVESSKKFADFNAFCVEKETADFENFFRNLPPSTQKPDIASVRQNTVTPAYTNKPSWLFHRGVLQKTDPILCCYMDSEPKRSGLRVLYENPDYNAITFHSGVYPAFTSEHIVGYIGKEGTLSPRQTPPYLMITFQDILNFAYPGAPKLKSVQSVRTQQDIASDETVLTKYYFLLPAGDRGSVIINFLDSPSF